MENGLKLFQGTTYVDREQNGLTGDSGLQPLIQQPGHGGFVKGPAPARPVATAVEFGHDLLKAGALFPQKLTYTSSLPNTDLFPGILLPHGQAASPCVVSEVARGTENRGPSLRPVLRTYVEKWPQPRVEPRQPGCEW